MEKGNESAFPAKEKRMTMQGPYEETTRGLTKREYMATQIMAGMTFQNSSYQKGSVGLRAERAVEAADELLKALGDE